MVCAFNNSGEFACCEKKLKIGFPIFCFARQKLGFAYMDKKPFKKL
jgi:hypothetical protein